MAVSISIYTAVVTAVLLPILFAIHRLYFHPLSRYNGPRLWALTRLPYMLAFRSGQLAHKIKSFHEIYGDTVRVAPNEVSFIDPTAIKDIYNRQPNPHYKSLPKDPVRQPPPRPGQPINILEANDTDHTRLRKAYAASFSTQALTAQEPLVTTYVHKMIAQIKARTTTTTNGAVIDLQDWISYCTFDIMCSLSLGADFGCLDQDRYHEWVGMLVHSLKGRVQLASCRFYPWLFNYLVQRLPETAQRMAAQHQATTKEKVQQRLRTEVDRPDFLSHLQRSKHELSDGEMEVNAATLIFAGSHTLQTAITGIVFHLLQHPDALARVTGEVRSSFATAEEIDSRKLSRLPVLEAAIKEGIRLTSPVPLGLTRLVPAGGHTICGDFFPEGTIVSYMQWAANISPRNYTHPTEFHLDRWLHPTEAPFAHDHRTATQPFLQGPRDCIGQNLARMEISLILGHLLYHFDLDVPRGVESLGKWDDQETYAVWLKAPLSVKVVVR
ncbi:cytochrome P450 [Aspergillus ibericus CBS 121593]|uniref:Benzoate 4-monooxygenase cytochrome P450 n=1 Tax=Aspergillus ibericus CBS 121593 TaxID=1448316 RepID=A0A395H9Y2_9EURO|nr:benzoate 4-monooxygenase cytochrome P450 [Aspergillus ibericus CBS 121593]RAL04446.1 benzoate 4-monooxygenase cytochrome P450 [Aspergillus ibericus CBS 121593]